MADDDTSLDEVRRRIESGGRQFTENGQPLISSKGAVGVSQILPSTAQEVAQGAGLDFTMDRLRNDADYNRVLGDLYAKQLRAKFGNGPAALAAYNAGPNNPGVLHFAQTGDPSQLPAETKNYLRKAGYNMPGEPTDPAAPMLNQVVQGGQALQGQGREYMARQAGLAGRLDDTMRNVPPAPDYPMPQPPPKEAQHTDFLQEFGSVASTLATLGALLTRHPLTAALTASAAAMKAIQGREVETYREQMGIWKANAEYAGQVQAALDRKYKNILDAHKGDVNTILAEMKANAAAFGDQVTLHHLETGDLNTIYQHLNHMESMRLRYQTATRQMSEASDKTYEFMARMVDPNYRPQAMKLLNDFKEQYGRTPTKEEAMNILIDNKVPPKQKTSDSSGQGADDVVKTLRAGGRAKIGTFEVGPDDLKMVEQAQILGQSALTPAQAELKRRLLANAKGAKPVMEEAPKTKSGEPVEPLPTDKTKLKTGSYYAVSKDKIPSGIGKWDGTHLVPAD